MSELVSRVRPAAILFDMDGLLIDSERIALASLAVASAHLGIDFPSHVAQRLIGLGRDGGSAVIRGALGESFPLAEFWHAWSQDYLRRVEEGVPAKVEVAATLEYVAAKNVPMAVATSTETPWAKKKLLKAGIHHFFDHVVGRDAVPHGKPAPDLYLEAAARLKTKTSDCWAFEDSLPGLTAAVASGARAHWIPDVAMIESQQLPSGVERVESIAAIREWIR
ncbi:MAG: HAD family phosphatase [Burkholderiales bacterium]|nr:MAG: HAD family phosphatase [Burkholderiales bacterium]